MFLKLLSAITVCLFFIQLQPSAILVAENPVWIWPTADSLIVQGADSLAIDSLGLDSLRTDSLLADTSKTAMVKKDSIRIPIAENAMEAELVYNAEDSIVYDLQQEMVFLYGKAKLEQEALNLDAAEINFSYETRSLSARGRIDSTGHLVDIPHFRDKDQDFYANDLEYNFETNKGRIKQLMTQEGEGYLVSRKVKKNERDELFGKDAYYTTCNLEHPHYAIEVDKVKVVPNKVVVSGPANLVIQDVKTPIFLPFGIFPLDKGRRSGIILPTYGESPRQGFYLKGLGYYFGISDYLDLSLRGDFYTSGTRVLRGQANYAKRYKYDGSISVQRGSEVIGDRDTTDVRYATNSIQINWSHRQNPKARPYSQFTARVSAGSTNFNRDFEADSERYLSNQLGSSISYSHSLPGTPFRLSLGASHSQNISSGLFQVTLPELNIDMDRQFLLKRKKKVGKERWYEKFATSYDFDARAKLETLTDSLFTQSSLDALLYGAKQSSTTSANFKVMKHFTLTPNFTVTNRIYPESYERKVDHYFTPVVDEFGEPVLDDFGNPRIDTTGVISDVVVKGLKLPTDYSAGTSLRTALFGIYQFKGKIKALRHEMRPGVSYNYTPDFGKERYGYWKSYVDTISNDTVDYSVFSKYSSLYGAPGRGERQTVRFDVSNVFQMKVFDKKDTLNQERKINLLNQLNFGVSYNFAAEQYKWSSITMNGATNIFQKINVNFGASWDPYSVNEEGQRQNVLWFREKKWKLAQFATANLSLSTTFNSTGLFAESGASRPQVQHAIDTRMSDVTVASARQELQDIVEFPEDYFDFDTKWNLRLNYNLRMSSIYNLEKQDFELKQSSNTLNGSVDLSLTPKWKIAVSTGYDFVLKDLNRTDVQIIRDLHCWEMRFNWVPSGYGRRYEFVIRVKSSMLQDLKLTRRRTIRDY